MLLWYGCSKTGFVVDLYSTHVGQCIAEYIVTMMVFTCYEVLI